MQPQLTTDTWTGSAGDNNWGTSGNWSAGVPTSSDAVTIGTTTANVNINVAASAGTLTLSNSGDTVTVENAENLTMSGNITNNGTLNLDSTSTYSQLEIGASNVTLSGTGTLNLNGTAAFGYIDAVTTGNTLTNASTITGWGNFGDSNLTISNSGTINANNNGNILYLEPYYSSSVSETNSGTMEATNGGQLYFYNGATWNNTGTISAAANSAVYLENGVTINGGTFSTTGSGWIYGVNATVSGVTISSGSQFEVPNSDFTYFTGTITNQGTITLDSTSTYSQFYVPSGTTTLTGGGTLVMGGGAPYGLIDGASGAAFVNSNNTIEGYGNIGYDALTLTNNGTINANTSPTVVNQPLVIQAGPGGMTNTSILEATNGGTLEIENTTLTNSGSSAVIQANGSDTSGNASNVVLSSSTITGGTLSTSGAGVIYGEDGTELIGVTNTGNFNVPNANAVYLSGTITNSGTITLSSSSTYSQLVLAANTTLSGGGTIVMGAGAEYALLDGSSGLTLTNSNNTIEGYGNIGYDDIAFVNNSVVNANVSGQTLTLQPTAGTNTKTLEATNGGELYFENSTWTNTGGTITAGASSSVVLSNTTINGGTLTTSGTGASAGVIYGEDDSELIAVTTTGNLNVPNSEYIYLSGTITNSGTITLNSTSTYSQLVLAANTTLSGGGTIVMGAGAPYGYIDGSSGLTLTNSNNTIEGYGNIGDGDIIFINNSVVNANTSGETLTLQPTAGTNTKTLEATNGGELEFYGSSWTNTGGTITAAASSTVLLYDTTITGGTLTTSGTGSTAGIIQLENNAELVGLTNSGGIQVPNGQTGEISGTITNSGTITLESTSTFTDLYLEANSTLSGKGTVVMGDGAQYTQIYGITGDTLTNSGNTIEGQGSLGLGYLTFNNSSGTVEANVSGGTLTIQSDGSGAGTTNNGTFEATGGGTLTVLGTLTNYSTSTNTLTGGTYIANASGSNVYLPLGSSGGIATLSASITEENGGQILNSNNSNNNALNGLTTITSTGSLTIGGVAFTDSGAFSNAGTLTILSGESFDVGSLTQISSSGSLTAGTFVLDGNLTLTGTAQTITTNATNLTLGGGTIENSSNSTNALGGLANNTGTLTIAAAVSTTASSFSNTGTLTIDKGDSFTAANLTQISGSTISGSGTFVLVGNLDLTTSGINITTNSTNLTLEGGTINSDGVNALAALASNTKNLTIAAAVTTSAIFSNTGTLTIDSGDKFTAANLSQISSGTLTGGTYVLIGSLDLTPSGITVSTNSANLTLEGGTINSDGVNALSALAANTGNLTVDAKVTTSASSFSNTGTLTVDKSESFTAGNLTQISSGSLTAGTYVLAGNIDLTTTGISITSNAANLTLEGGTIDSGTANALAGLASNSGTLTLASDVTVTTGSSAFTNSGTVDVQKGSTLTVGGTNNNYNQTAGTTTIDGTLKGMGTGAADITGGTLQGAGTISGNVSAGNASGTAVTINAGDAGAAGLLSITGTYTQLATGTLTGLIDGTKQGTSYSELKVTGAATLAGTINFTVASSFIGSLTVGEQFTVLTAKSITGTFSNSTIAINSTLQFDVSYTSTGVVLTVADVTPSKQSSAPAQPAAAVAKVATEPEGSRDKSTSLSSLRHWSGEKRASAKAIFVGLEPRHDGGSELIGLRSWERIPVVSTSNERETPVVKAITSHDNELPRNDLRLADIQPIGKLPVTGFPAMGNAKPRVMVNPMLPLIPRAAR